MQQQKEEKEVGNEADTKINIKYTLRSEIDEKKLNMFRAFVNDKKYAVQELYIHSNVDAQDPNDFARGFTAVLGEDAVLTADVLHRDMHTQVMLFKVVSFSSESSEKDFDENATELRDRLNYAVQQSVPKDMQASLTSHCLSESKSLYDSKKWISTLGADGRIGLYRIEKTEDTFDYYLLVQTGATALSNELYRWIYEQNSITAKALLASTEYRYARSVAQRNAQRLAAKAAEALNLRIETVPDHWAYHNDQKCELQPQMGLPCVHNEYNLVLPGELAEKKVFYMYDGTCSTKESKGALLLLQDPRSSVFLFPAVEKVYTFESKQQIDASDRPLTKNVRRAFQTNVLSIHEGVTHNKAADSFPLTLGTLCNVQQAYEMRENLKAEQRRMVNRRITWEGKPEDAEKKWFNHRVVDGTVRRFNTNDAELNKLVQKLYDRDLSAVEQLKPVLLKISSNKYNGFDL